MSNVVRLPVPNAEFYHRYDESGQSIVGYKIQNGKEFVIFDDSEDGANMVISNRNASIGISKDDFSMIAIAWLRMNCPDVIRFDD